MAKRGQWRAHAAAIICAVSAIACGSWPVESNAGDLDESARVIAGISSSLNSGKAGEGLWRSYAQEVSSYWRSYETKIGRAMREVGKPRTRSGRRSDGFLSFLRTGLPSVVALFPAADRYVLVSLQRAEAPPRLQDSPGKQLEKLPGRIPQGMEFYGAMGFSRRRPGRRRQRAHSTHRNDRTADAFAVRLGYEIEAVESLLLDRDGNLRNRRPGRLVRGTRRG